MEDELYDPFGDSYDYANETEDGRKIRESKQLQDKIGGYLKKGADGVGLAVSLISPYIGSLYWAGTSAYNAAKGDYEGATSRAIAGAIPAIFKGGALVAPYLKGFNPATALFAVEGASRLSEDILTILDRFKEGNYFGTLNGWNPLSDEDAGVAGATLGGLLDLSFMNSGTNMLNKLYGKLVSLLAGKVAAHEGKYLLLNNPKIYNFLKEKLYDPYMKKRINKPVVLKSNKEL